MRVFAILSVPPLLLWVIFRIIMRLKTRREGAVPKDLPTFTKVWGYPLLAFGYLLDFVCNVFHSTLLFLELPKETTVSARVKRHTNDSKLPSKHIKYVVLWRRLVARTLRDRVLKPYDPSGGHD